MLVKLPDADELPPLEELPPTTDRRTGGVVKWQVYYRTMWHGPTWIDMNEIHAAEVEEMYREDHAEYIYTWPPPVIGVAGASTRYTINFADRTQTNGKTGFKRKIRRIIVT